jgi:hypothetical protein
VLSLLLLASACANSGVPETWEDQPDETGQGLAERNFVSSCVEANDDLPDAKAESYCTCVLVKVKAAISYEEFGEFDDFIDTHRADITAETSREHFGWLTAAVAACPV